MPAPGENGKHYYNKNGNDNVGQWRSTREASASTSTQNGRMSQDFPKLEQEAEEEEQQQVQVSIVGRENAGVFEQQDDSDTDEHLVIHAPSTNSLFEDRQQNGENNNEINMEYVPHTPTATPPPTPPSLPPTPDTEDDFEEPPFQDQQVKQERSSPSPSRSPVNNDGFLNHGPNNIPNPPPRHRLQRESMSFPGGIAVRTVMDRLLNGNVTHQASRAFDRMAGVTTPEKPPLTPYFSFFPGPGMYPVPTQLYCSYPFLLKCLSASISYLSFREHETSSNEQNGFSAGTPRPRGTTSSTPPGFGMIRAPSASARTSSSRKSSTTPSATVTSQTSNTSGSCGWRMFAPPPPLLSPIPDGPPAGYFFPFTLNGSQTNATLSSPTSSSAWRFPVPILHLQPPSGQQEQQGSVNLDNNDTQTRNPSSLPVVASSSQTSSVVVGETRGRRRDDGDRRTRRDGTRSRSRIQNRFRNERHEPTDRQTDVNYHHHHYHRLSPHAYPYSFNNCRHCQDQRRCDYCRDSWNNLLDSNNHASSSSSLRRRHSHDQDNNNDSRGRRHSSREGRSDFKSKSNYGRRDRR